MTLEWDYTELAEAYRKRPPYSRRLLDDLFRQISLRPGMRACDVGAGTGNLTVPLTERGFRVSAVEPNSAMRAIGQERTAGLPEIEWYPTLAENTGLPDLYFDLVAFGSSFNVVRREEALEESWRMLRDGGWFTCLWNYRNLTDLLQREIEQLIRSFLPDYRYGTRREDQTPIIEARGRFRVTDRLEDHHSQIVEPADWLDAWKSHATLRRQAGDRFPAILQAVETLLGRQTSGPLEVRYITRAWLARKRE